MKFKWKFCMRTLIHCVHKKHRTTTNRNMNILIKMNRWDIKCCLDKTIITLLLSTRSTPIETPLLRRLSSTKHFTFTFITTLGIFFIINITFFAFRGKPKSRPCTKQRQNILSAENKIIQIERNAFLYDILKMSCTFYPGKIDFRTKVWNSY